MPRGYERVSFPPEPADSRRSFSEIVPPPLLSTRHLDPFSAPRRFSEDSRDSETDSDASGNEFDEKTHFERSGEEEVWDKAAALRHDRRLYKYLLLPPIFLVAALLLTLLSTHIFRNSAHTFHGAQLTPITMAHLRNGTFAVERKTLDWLAEAGDGVYSWRTDQGDIWLGDVSEGGVDRVLVNGSSVLDTDGSQLAWSTFKVSADLKYILFGVDRSSQWRHSSHSNFYIHTLADSTTSPLRPPSNPPHTAIAQFSPRGHHIVYVHANDLYVLESPSSDGKYGDAIRITTNGGPTTFNGIPDWVYEEEVFSSDTTTYWSPSGDKIAYLSFDEELVQEYEFPIYNPSSEIGSIAPPYTTSTVMRYPKPGTHNPLVSLSVFDLKGFADRPKRSTRPTAGSTGRLDPNIAASTYSLVFSKPFAKDDEIITEVSWVGENDLIVKATDRISRKLRVAHFQLLEGGESRDVVVGKVVREVDYAREGWVEPGQTITTLTNPTGSASGAPIPTPLDGYLDVIPDSKGFNHIALFSPIDNGSPQFLTSGKWEVDGSILGVDHVKNLIYYSAATPSTSRHIYSIPLTQRADEASVVEPIGLSNVTLPGMFKASFSPFGAFYLLSYDGPNIPYQRLVRSSDQKIIQTLTDNKNLAKLDAMYAKPDIVYTTAFSGEYELNVVELRPPMMDLSGRTKYPVLFQVYGGPASQKVSVAYSRDWHHFLCTSLNYIIVTVDPRGTGFKGRNFRMPVRERLGELEAIDVVEVARQYAALEYVDAKRIGVWGWSYGGFLTSKIVQQNSGVFTLGMAVAPVTDWRFYDSIYTERYMSTPQLNPAGYYNSSIHSTAGFTASRIDFALAHGSGDDNVHFLNSAALLDRLTGDGVRGWRFRMFTDSDHGISTRGAYWELMQWLTDFLVEKWGEGGRDLKSEARLEKVEKGRHGV